MGSSFSGGYFESEGSALNTATMFVLYHSNTAVEIIPQSAMIRYYDGTAIFHGP